MAAKYALVSVLCVAYWLAFVSCQTLLDRGMVQIGSPVTIGGMTGLTAFANYTDPNSGQNIFFWGGNNAIYRLTDSPDNVASAQKIYTASASVRAIMVAPATNYGFFCMNKNVYRFSLSNPSGGTTDLGSYSCGFCINQLVGTYADCVYAPASDTIYIASSGDIVAYTSVSGAVGSIGKSIISPITAFLTNRFISIDIDIATNTILFGGARDTPTRGTVGAIGIKVGTSAAITTERNYPITVVVNNPRRNSFLVGDNVGSAVEVDANLLSRQLYFETGVTVSTIGYGKNPNITQCHTNVIQSDAINDVVFVGAQDSTTSQSAITRLTQTWQYFGQSADIVAKPFGFTYFDVANNWMYWSTKSGSGDALYKMQITSCSIYDCLTCVQDAIYCGFCNQERNCTLSRDCSQTDQWYQDTRYYVCPVIQKLDPARGSVDGNTIVNVTSTYGDASGVLLNSADFRCVWDESTVTLVNNLQFQSLQCVSPPKSGGAGSKNLRIRWKNTWWTTNSASFTYYQCSASPDCASCFTETECGLCLTNSTCGSIQRCSADAWTRSCPAVTSLSSLGSSIRGNKLITLTISPTVVPNANYTCVFDGTFETQATRVSSTSISCRTPDIRSQWDTLRNGQAEIKTTLEVHANGKLYTSTSGFIFYDCTLYAQDCSTCTDVLGTVTVRDDCTFCFNTRSCTYKADATASCSTTGTCPAINNVVPSSVYYGDLATTTIRISGLFVFDGQSLPTLKCAWNVGTAVTLADLTDATPTNNTYISCPIQSTLSVGTTKVSVWADIGGGSYQRLTPDASIFVYDCSSISCLDCASDMRPTCSWCGTNLQCIHDGSATCAAQATASNSSTCPAIISANPASASTLGDESIVFLGSFVFSQVTSLSSVKCMFGNLSVPAVNYTDTSVTCLTVPASVGVVPAYISVNNIAYTNSVSFTFYDCTAITSGCNECLAPTNTRCTWCTQYCAFECNVGDITQAQCPTLTSVEPNYGYFEGGETVVVTGGPFFNRADFSYTCLFDDQPADSSTISAVNQNILTCVTPSRRRLIGNVQLRVLLNGDDIAPNTPLNFTFFSCNSFSTGSGCQAQCMADSPYCGWCLTTKTCGPQTRCTGSEEFFLQQCIEMTVAPNYATLFGNDSLAITVTPSIDPFIALASVSMNGTKKRSVSDSFFCEFEGVPKVSATVVNSSSLECTPPRVIFESSLNFRVLFESTAIAGPVPFTFVDCSQLTTCSKCIAKNLCGWCSESNSCTTQATCSSAELWADNCSAAVDVAGLVAGVVVGGSALIAGTVLLILFMRWRKRRGGLIVEVVEPDYLTVAYQTDLTLKYKINAKDDYQQLEDVLMSRDRTFVDAVAEVTAPTEQDAVAKYLIFLAQNKQQGAEMLQYFVSEEARKASSENTIFRLNSIGSKMFKYYSKLVGTKYLWSTLARVVNELNTVAAKAMKDADRMDSDDKGASLLQIEMEVDPNKIKDASVDTDQNVYQLALACQKIFTVIKNGEDKVPNEFRQIFSRMSYTIMDKFGNEDAVFKAIGGLLFLRYIGPALTAPHYYGLLHEAPNQVAQRQLVLIAKVLQTLANMATNNKEAYMENLSDFVNRNRPKIADFYRSILNTQERAQAKVKMDLELPSEVRLNSLAYLHEHIVRNESKIRERFTQIEDEEKSAQMIHLLNAILDMYGELPKKKEQGSKDKKKETLDV